VLRMRDKSLEVNPFIKNILSKENKEKLREHRTYITLGANFKNMDIEGGWIRNYPSFCMDTLDISYKFDNTEILWISPSIHWKGLKVKANYSYSYKLAPHIPLVFVSVEYDWGNLAVIPTYKYIKDYKGKMNHLLFFNLSWHSPYQFIYSISRPTFFIEGENLFNGYEIWKGYREKPKFCVGAKFKL